jgi:hypothetical protein
VILQTTSKSYAMPDVLPDASGFLIDVVILYVRDPDQPIAEQIKRDLERRGARTFVAQALEDQTPLISRSLVETLTSVIKFQAAQVLVLYRPAWDLRPWTQIERDAIHDRRLRDPSLSFLKIALMDGTQAPPWYPESRAMMRFAQFGVQGVVDACLREDQDVNQDGLPVAEGATPQNRWHGMLATAALATGVAALALMSSQTKRLPWQRADAVVPQAVTSANTSSGSGNAALHSPETPLAHADGHVGSTVAVAQQTAKPSVSSSVSGTRRRGDRPAIESASTNPIESAPTNPIAPPRQDENVAGASVPTPPVESQPVWTKVIVQPPPIIDLVERHVAGSMPIPVATVAEAPTLFALKYGRTKGLLRVQDNDLKFDDYKESHNFSTSCSMIQHASVYNNNPLRPELHIYTDAEEYKLTDDDVLGLVDRANRAIQGLINKCPSKTVSAGG